MEEEKGKQAEERQDEPRLWRPWRQPRRRMRWVLWAVGMVVAVLIAVLTTALLILYLPPEIWKGLSKRWVLPLVALGFSLTAIVVMLAIAGARRSWTGFQGKTVWDFLQLLIVPLMLVAIGFWFTAQQDARQQQIENQRAQQAQKIENQRAAAEHKLAEQRAQDEALQAYLDEMKQLLLEKNLRDSEPGNEVRVLARARTLSTLGRIDADHKLSLLQFLYEADLINSTQPVINLDGANLQNVDLSYVNLSHAPQLQRSEIQGGLGVCVVRSEEEEQFSFRHFYGGCDTYQEQGYVVYVLSRDLRGTDLSATSLHGADLRWSVLAKAHLQYADLSDANLHYALLADSELWSADLTNADLTVANLAGANLFSADLSGADLTGADLTDAKVSKEQLDQVDSLEGATMPNEKYEDWLKDREGRK